MSSNRTETTIPERKIILHLRKEGKSYADIGEIMDRSRFIIRTICKRFEGASNLKSGKHGGRPKQLSIRESFEIVRKVKKDPKITSTKIATPNNNKTHTPQSWF